MPVALALLAWFALTTALTGAGVYRPAEYEVAPAVGLALLASLIGLGLIVAAFPALRAALTLPTVQSGLVTVQVWRVLGISFLVLMAQGQLPGLFALPAGLGDIAVGATAPLIARNLHRPAGRRWAIAWNLFGFADLVLAVVLGAAASPGAAQLFLTTPTAEPMTAFPMALVPTFLVPLSMALHVASLRFLCFPPPGEAGVNSLSAAASGKKL